MAAMAALRSRRLASLLGAPVDQLTAAHIQSLVTNNVTEEFDLDFKETLYGHGDADKRALAGDVAALANTAGGIVVIGVAEDDQARATAADGVELSDAERARMLQVIASGVSPMPTVDIVPVPLESETIEPEADDQADPADPDATVTGYYVIAVPRSTSAPHAVIVNEGFRYPKRNGATTRYLSEPEVAASYRDRLSGLEAQTRHIEQIEAEAKERLHRDETPWVMVSLVPDLLGDIDITYSLQQTFQQQTVGRPAYDIIQSGGISFMRAGVGRRRLTADGSSSGEPKAKHARVEYHWDGAGVYALALWDMWQEARAQSVDPEKVNQLVDDESIVVSVVTGLRRLALHARDRAGAGGNALVRVHLLPSLTRGVEIGHTRSFGFRDSRSSVALTDHIGAAETVASLDELAEPGPPLVAVAARLIDEIGQVFGIPEMGQVTRDGEVRIRYWNNRMQPQVKAWAEQHGVTVTSVTLDG